MVFLAYFQINTTIVGENYLESKIEQWDSSFSPENEVYSEGKKTEQITEILQEYQTFSLRNQFKGVVSREEDLEFILLKDSAQLLSFMMTSQLTN